MGGYFEWVRRKRTLLLSKNPSGSSVYLVGKGEEEKD